MTVEALRHGRPAVLAELLERYGRDMHAVAYLILRDRSDAEDVVADSLLAALDRGHSRWTPIHPCPSEARRPGRPMSRPCTRSAWPPGAPTLSSDTAARARWSRRPTVRTRLPARWSKVRPTSFACRSYGTVAGAVLLTSASTASSSPPDLSTLSQLRGRSRQATDPPVAGVHQPGRRRPRRRWTDLGSPGLVLGASLSLIRRAGRGRAHVGGPGEAGRALVRLVRWPDRGWAHLRCPDPGDQAVAAGERTGGRGRA